MSESFQLQEREQVGGGGAVTTPTGTSKCDVNNPTNNDCCKVILYEKNYSSIDDGGARCCYGKLCSETDSYAGGLSGKYGDSRQELERVCGSGVNKDIGGGTFVLPNPRNGTFGKATPVGSHSIGILASWAGVSKGCSIKFKDYKSKGQGLGSEATVCEAYGEGGCSGGNMPVGARKIFSAETGWEDSGWKEGVYFFKIRPLVNASDHNGCVVSHSCPKNTGTGVGDLLEGGTNSVDPVSRADIVSANDNSVCGLEKLMELKRMEPGNVQVDINSKVAEAQEKAERADEDGDEDEDEGTLRSGYLSFDIDVPRRKPTISLPAPSPSPSPSFPEIELPKEASTINLLPIKKKKCKCRCSRAQKMMKKYDENRSRSLETGELENVIENEIPSSSGIDP